MFRRPFAAALIGLTFAAAAQAEERAVTFRGYAYDLDSNRFLYTEVHRPRIDGDRWVGGTIDYYAPDGTQIGHKTLDFSQDPYVPLYRLTLSSGGGYMEGITAIGPKTLSMEKQGYGETKVRTATIQRHDPVVADSGFHSFLRDRFPELLEGKTVRFTFAVSGNLDQFRFRAVRLADTTFEGQPAVLLRVEPDTLLRLLADPLFITYEPKQRKMLEYRGVSNLHDPKTHEAYKVRIVYPSKVPDDAPPLPEGA